MSFQKINLCAGTAVAMNVFHMLRDDVINLVKAPDSRWSDLQWIKYENTDYPPAEGEVCPYDNKRFTDIADLLRGQCKEIRIHEMETDDEPGCESSRRLVEFIVESHLFGCRSAVVSILVGKEFLDGDEVSGWTDWKMVMAEIQTFTNEQSTKITLRVMSVSSHDSIYPSDPMRRNVGGLIYLC